MYFLDYGDKNNNEGKECYLNYIFYLLSKLGVWYWENSDDNIMMNVLLKNI